MQGRLNLGKVLLDSVRVYLRGLPVFLPIVSLAGGVAGFITVVMSRQILGFSAEGAGVDPTTLRITLNREQWVMVMAGGIAMAVVISVAMAATIHAACERLGLGAALAKLTAKSMQIFWLQVAVYVVAARFSPFAVPLLWFPLAFGIGLALREDLGPNDAMERAWTLSSGSRARILLLEVLLLVPVLAVVGGIGYLFLIPGPWLNLNAVNPLYRQYLSAPITVMLLIPVQFMFVGLARAYEALRRSEVEAGLHAEAGSSVSST
ncbi:MAG: hypothetical protein RL328_837 [Acidobacteriota bacterium]|jgi:hypothetical protein